VCILGVTSRYGDIATAQNSADAVALAYVSRDLASAQKLADALHVTIEQVTTDGPVVTVTIRSGSLMATAQASP
jgi:riboflavin biosynthesis pyrimidine reductase